MILDVDQMPVVESRASHRGVVSAKSKRTNQMEPGADGRTGARGSTGVAGYFRLHQHYIRRGNVVAQGLSAFQCRKGSLVIGFLRYFGNQLGIEDLVRLVEYNHGTGK